MLSEKDISFGGGGGRGGEWRINNPYFCLKSPSSQEKRYDLHDTFTRKRSGMSYVFGWCM